MKNLISTSLLSVMVVGTATASERLNNALSTIAKPDPSQNTEKVSTNKEDPKGEPKVELPEYKWTGPGLSENEQVALRFFQDQGITDRAALATLLGNIKQESRFHSNICEGGARIAYKHCHRGGYGLIQWTTVGRYDGLGRHAKANNCDPSTLKCQLGYLVTEREWKESLWRFKTPNKSINFYMKGAYRWLGWGIYGARGSYSYRYYDFLKG